jgi:nucleotide-binding universal stress UspA family protein
MSRRLSRKPLKKILYTTDLSPNSVYVLRYAIIAAQKHGDRLIVLHVLEDLPPTALALSFAYLDDENYFNITHRKTIHAKQRILKRLQIVCDRELNGDPEAEEMVESIEVVEGYPTDVILAKADEFNCDLIIMGTHGKGFLRHPYFGSTSKKVVRRARKPVFFVPMPAGDTDLSIHDQ